MHTILKLIKLKDKKAQKWLKDHCEFLTGKTFKSHKVNVSLSFRQFLDVIKKLGMRRLASAQKIVKENKMDLFSIKLFFVKYFKNKFFKKKQTRI